MANIVLLTLLQNKSTPVNNNKH